MSRVKSKEALVNPINSVIVGNDSKKSISPKLRNKKWKSLSKPRKLVAFFLILLSINILGYSGVRVGNIRSVDGYAEWRSSNGQSYLYVEAPNNFELGYLTGHEIAPQIFWLQEILMILSSSFNTSYRDLKLRAQAYLSTIPADLQDEMRGLALGASNKLGFPFTFNDILVQNTFLDILYGQVMPENFNPLGCTAIAAYSNESHPIFGQNFDFPQSFSKTVSFILHKLPNTPAIFGIRFGATLNLPLGKNEYQISSLITVVKVNTLGEPSMPATCRTRLAFEQAQSANQYVDLFYSEFGVNVNGGFTSIVSDNTSFIVIDSVTGYLQILKPYSAVRTNTFTNPTWQTFLYNSSFSKERQLVAEEQLCEKLDDNFLTSSELMEILKLTPIICQHAENGQDISTLAFLTQDYFGLGSPDSYSWGNLPI